MNSEVHCSVYRKFAAGFGSTNSPSTFLLLEIFINRNPLADELEHGV